MLISAVPQQSVYAGIALLCSLCACVTDLRSRKIPNALTGACILVGLLVHSCIEGWYGLASSGMAGIAAGAFFFLIYAAGGIGAGDVKLVAAVGCMNGLSSLQTILVATLLSGGVFALVFAIRRGQFLHTLRNVAVLLAHHGRRGLRPHAALNVSNRDLLHIPYALAIAFGCMAAVWTAVSGHLV